MVKLDGRLEVEDCRSVNRCSRRGKVGTAFIAADCHMVSRVTDFLEAFTAIHVRSASRLPIVRSPWPILYTGWSQLSRARLEK